MIDPATAPVFRISVQYEAGLRAWGDLSHARREWVSCNQLAPAALSWGAKGRTGVDMSIREPLLPWMRRDERGAGASTFEPWEVGRGLRQFVARQTRRPPIWP